MPGDPRRSQPWQEWLLSCGYLPQIGSLVYILIRGADAPVLPYVLPDHANVLIACGHGHGAASLQQMGQVVKKMTRAIVPRPRDSAPPQSQIADPPAHPLGEKIDL